MHRPYAMPSSPAVNVARLTYLLICEAAGFFIALSIHNSGFDFPLWGGLVGGLVLAGFFILVETLIKGFTLRGFSTATFGLCVGLFCAWLLTRVQLVSLFEQAFRDRYATHDNYGELVESLRLAFDVSLFASLGFIGAVLALRSNRDDFAFVIPYVRFRQDVLSGQPIVLDHEAIMDGRVPAILRAGFLFGRLIIPRFVLDELHTLANSASSTARQRGQRGLECLEQMQAAKDIQIAVHDTQRIAADETMTARLLETTRLLGARLMTVDETLTKVAKLQSVPVLNLHELDEALKPSVAVGERLRIALVRGGKDEHQAVGYLPDGTMIVVNHAAAKIGSAIDVLVISTLQTAAGTLVFAEPYEV
jgi:uncharacterized protein YacL